MVYFRYLFVFPDFEFLAFLHSGNIWKYWVGYVMQLN